MISHFIHRVPRVEEGWVLDLVQLPHGNNSYDRHYEFCLLLTTKCVPRVHGFHNNPHIIISRPLVIPGLQQEAVVVNLDL